MLALSPPWTRGHAPPVGMPPPRAIQAALLQAGIRSRPLAEHRGPGLTLYRLALPPADMARALGQRAAISAALDCPGVTIAQRGALLEVCRPAASPATLSLSAVGPCLGIDAAGRQVLIHLDRTRPHAVVAGMTGSGKSELLRTLALLESRRADTTLILIDLKGGAFDELAAKGHHVATDGPGALAALGWAAARIGRSDDGRRVAVIVDEAAHLSAAAAAAARDIAERGRAAGLRLVLATQYIRADVLDRRITTAAAWRICGRVFDVPASRLVLGQAGAEQLAGGGDFLLSEAGAPAVRFRAALADPASWGRAGEGEPLDLPAPAAEPDGEDMVSWAAETGASARAIRMRYGIGQDKARRVRDEAAGMTDRLPTVIRPDFAARVTGQSVSHREASHA